MAPRLGLSPEPDVSDISDISVGSRPEAGHHARQYARQHSVGSRSVGTTTLLTTLLGALLTTLFGALLSPRLGAQHGATPTHPAAAPQPSSALFPCGGATPRGHRPVGLRHATAPHATTAQSTAAHATAAQSTAAHATAAHATTAHAVAAHATAAHAAAACPPQWLPSLLAYAVPAAQWPWPPPPFPPPPLPLPPPPPPSPPPSPPQGAPPSSHYTFARGTFQPRPIGAVRGCAALDYQLSGPHLNEAIDVCFDRQFACAHASPFVGMAMIRGQSDGNPQAGEQASVRLEGSDLWLPALVPMHAPRGSRRTTSQPVAVVGCLVGNSSRFVLSWADMRCHSSKADAAFPAECDGAFQRGVPIENPTAAISFVDGLAPRPRRKLGLGDTESVHALGRRTAVIVLISPSDALSALAPWDLNLPIGDTVYLGDVASRPAQWADAVVSVPLTMYYSLCTCTLVVPRVPCTRYTPHSVHARRTRASQMSKVDAQMQRWSWGQLAFNWTVVGPFTTTAEYTLANCNRTSGAGSTELDRKRSLGAAAAAGAGVDVDGYDFQIYWQPRCSNAGFGGVAWVGGNSLLMNGGSAVDGTAKTLAHELGHNCAATPLPLCSVAPGRCPPHRL